MTKSAGGEGNAAFFNVAPDLIAIRTVAALLICATPLDHLLRRLRNVPLCTLCELCRAQSPGSYYNAWIKGTYERAGAGTP